MNTINQKSSNNYIFQKSVNDYQNLKLSIEQGLKFPEEGIKQKKDDFISEKLVTNLNAGIGRMISSESVLPSFGWGRGFFSNVK